MDVEWAGLLIWIPTVAVVAMVAVACLGALMLPERAPRRRYGLLVAALCGAAAIAATAWQQRSEAGLLAAQREAVEAQRREVVAQEEELAKIARRLHVAWEMFRAATQQLPAAPGGGGPKSFDTADAGFAALMAEAEALSQRIEAFRMEQAGRAIDDATATAMADWLRQRGRHRVVVTCVAKDEEAYLYANRLATIFRQAGWDAAGPETTAIFGDAPTLAVGLYARGGETPEAARILVEAFTKFSIPYQSRIAGNAMIPDPDTLELFVAKKP